MLEDDQTKDVSLHDDTSTAADPKPISSDLDPGDGKRKLYVFANATISGDESPTKYQQRIDFESTTPVTVTNAGDTSIFLFTGIGLLDFVSLQGSRSGYEFVLKVDGVEQVRISMDNLNDIGLTTPSNVPIWVETADKNFRYHPFGSAGFSTSFEILAKATGAADVELNHLITYREKT